MIFNFVDREYENLSTTKFFRFTVHVYSYNNITAQPSSILAPRGVQNVCHGEIVSYNCTTNGSIMDLYCPPLVTLSRPLRLLAREPVGTFRWESNSTATAELLQFNGSSSFMGRLTLYITDEQSLGAFDVHCRASLTDGRSVTDTAIFSMSGEVHYMQ